MMKTSFRNIAISTLALAVLAVSCRKDEIITEKPVIYNSNGLPVVTIKTDNGAGVPADKTVIVLVTRKPGSVKHTAHKTTHADGWHKAQVRDWGEFTLAADTTAPTVRAVNFSEGKPLKTNTLKVRIGDDLAGIETYHCYLNGQWVLAEYDGKTATLVLDSAGKLKAGPNRLRVVVTDGTGNTTDLTWNLTK